MSYYNFPRAAIGYAYLEKLIDALGSTKSKITLIYNFERGELVLNDDDLIEKIKLLKIPHRIIPRSKSLAYVEKQSEG